MTNDRSRLRRRIIFAAALLLAVVVPSAAFAYVGPGAGIAFATTALALLSTVAVVVFGAVLWPIRWVYLLFTQKKPPGKQHFERVVVVGLDGIDPGLVEEMMEAGELPNMSKIAKQGNFQRLGTTWPAMSPVAWSSFSTGVNPGKHGIYDFLTRDPKTYAPDLSSAQVRGPARVLKIGNWQLPLSKPQVRLLKRSKTFWKILGDEYRIPCSILRVPVTFPPERFQGMMLSAMCVPDMMGSQGTFTHLVQQGYQRDPEQEENELNDPYAVGMTRDITFDESGKRGKVTLIGPENPLRSDRQKLAVDIEFEVDRENGFVVIELPGAREVLRPGVYSRWMEVAFPLGLGLKMRGIARFRVLEMDPLRVYVSPINIDPAQPVLPISHPKIFSVFLAKLIGPFATLGLAEDTWALNEGVLDDEGFLEQAWLNHGEREEMLFQMLKRTKKGFVACVFDGTDRIQHMFWRYRDPKHPAVEDENLRERYKRTIEDTYQRCDEMLGRVMEQVDIESGKEALIVMSDHGFTSFRRGINLNTWLFNNGYLFLEEGREESGEWFRGIDWTRTKAFALGLGGIFLNVEGREELGIVKESEADALAKEIADGLRGLVDDELGEVAIQECYLASEIYDGPYVDEAPHVIVGYTPGWRASWDGARGKMNNIMFDDNKKGWSGDHCVDPVSVPGVLLSSSPIGSPDEQPSIIDVAPTILDWFGVKTPKFMDGSSLVRGGKEAGK